MLTVSVTDSIDLMQRKKRAASVSLKSIENISNLKYKRVVISNFIHSLIRSCIHSLIPFTNFIQFTCHLTYIRLSPLFYSTIHSSFLTLSPIFLSFFMHLLIGSFCVHNPLHPAPRRRAFCRYGMYKHLDRRRFLCDASCNERYINQAESVRWSHFGGNIRRRLSERQKQLLEHTGDCFTISMR